MVKLQYHFKYINDDKPFEMPNWTPEKHEKALAKLTEYSEGKKMTQSQANNEFKYFVIHETFLELDPTCPFEKVRNLHPMDLIEWFNAVYNAGRVGIYYKPDFQKGRKTTQKTQK
jgi:hypothetical protein